MRDGWRERNTFRKQVNEGAMDSWDAKHTGARTDTGGTDREQRCKQVG